MYFQGRGAFLTCYFSEMLRRIRVSHLPFSENLREIKSAKHATAIIKASGLQDQGHSRQVRGSPHPPNKT